MKIVKGLLFLLIGLLLILGIGTIFLPSDSHVERSIEVDAPASAVYDQVNNLKNWEKWSPWKKADPGMKIIYSSENPSGQGEWYSWDGEKSGKGKLTIKDAIPNQSLKTELVFDGMGTSHGFWKLEPTGNGTTVTWGFDSEFSGLSKWFGIMMEGQLGPQFEGGLAEIKKLAEAAPAPTANVIETQPAAVPVAQE